MTSIKPYKINISPSSLEPLMQKLALADFPDQDDLEKDSWTKVPPVREIKRLVDVWQTVYNWRDVESRLNQLPQFMTPIDISDVGAFNIHSVHKKSTKADAIPLVFVHGWPGSFYEVARVIDPLVHGDDKAGPTFHVVAPSLIDFGFSSPSKPTKETYPELHAQSLSTPLTDIEQRGLVRAAAFDEEGGGYYKVQSTKLMTTGYSLKDSPMGLLA
ncbi:hypothetical protein ACHAPQ_011926 [Fusarium lateritium]